MAILGPGVWLFGYGYISCEQIISSTIIVTVMYDEIKIL